MYVYPLTGDEAYAAMIRNATIEREDSKRMMYDGGTFWSRDNHTTQWIRSAHCWTEADRSAMWRIVYDCQWHWRD